MRLCLRLRKARAERVLQSNGAAAADGAAHGATDLANFAALTSDVPPFSHSPLDQKCSEVMHASTFRIRHLTKVRQEAI